MIGFCLLQGKLRRRSGFIQNGCRQDLFRATHDLPTNQVSVRVVRGPLTGTRPPIRACAHRDSRGDRDADGITNNLYFRSAQIRIARSHIKERLE